MNSGRLTKRWSSKRSLPLTSSRSEASAPSAAPIGAEPVTAALLDSEALRVLASPKERGASARRAQAIVQAAAIRNVPVRTPAAVLVEVCRGHGRDAAVMRVLNQGVEVLSVDPGTARVAARILSDADLDSAIDAIVVATAIRLSGALIVTSDPDDLSTLAVGHPDVEIQSL
jgi:predicted nucleic acid-binding protein